MKQKYFYKKRNTAKRSFLILLTFLVCIIIFLYFILERNLKPTILAMSENKARIIATQAINEVAYRKITQNEYKDLVTVMIDKDGKVTMLKIDPILMNRLAGETTLAIQEALENIETKSLKIPIANVFGSQLLANTGPFINVRIQPIGSVKVDYKPETETTGINMTRHNIYLFVETNIRIIAPFINNNVEVSTHVPISETIIVSIVSIRKLFSTDISVLFLLNRKV
ncbi:MAG: sporulation protein YunB [Clostridiales bacterium GWB2_37_7]|nr:MAG: sporulation protein YunB [Clostridiales bacterium GWB2_37_7]